MEVTRPALGDRGGQHVALGGAPDSERSAGRGGAAASPLEAVGDGQKQLALLESLHLLESLVVQRQEAAAGVLQQALLGRVELPHLRQLFGSHDEQLRDGRGQRHRVPVHTVVLKGPGHALELLEGAQDLLVAAEDPVSVLHCRAKRAESGERGRGWGPRGARDMEWGDPGGQT